MNSRRAISPHGNSSGDSAATATVTHKEKRKFTRSRSPNPNILRAPSSSRPSLRHRHLSPSVIRNTRYNSGITTSQNFLSSQCCLRLPLLPSSASLQFVIDTRQLGECLLLLISLMYGAYHVSTYPTPISPLISNPDTHNSIAFELYTLSAFTFAYLIWSHTTVFNPSSSSQPSTQNQKGNLSAYSTSALLRPDSPRPSENRRQPSSSVIDRSNFGYVWMSVPKNYRDSRDDGISTGLLLGPIIATSLLFTTIQQTISSGDVLPDGWLIEAPFTLPNSQAGLSAKQAVLLSRYSLVDMSIFCSMILLLHVCASWWMERRACKEGGGVDGERASVPRSEGRRSWYYVLFSLGTSLLMVTFKILMASYDVKLWKHLNIFEAVVASLFYQFTLYIALRLAHRGFTLGELALTCFGATAISLEFLNITIARIWPITTPYIKTYRLPTPLLVFQIALIVGALIDGFLLSPFLVLSRNYAQRPQHRLRFPQEKERNRKWFALAFYVGSVLIIGLLIGIWTRWCLNNRDPWVWVIFRLVEGKKKWTRPALLSYWILLGIISVAGWYRQLARSRRNFRPRNPVPAPTFVSTNLVEVTPPASSAETLTISSTLDSTNATTSTTSSVGPLGMTFPTSFPNISNLPNLPNLPNGANMSIVAADLLDAADKHVPTLGLNARRKYFHALAVVMFVPGIAVDPAFTHLSFSVAFAMFTFAEYIRYFAIYPFGASLHLFMNEFLDHRDRGTVILSHFYLLTGCAGSLWLEGPSRLLQFTGVLVLGLGDAAASIVGKRVGVHRWSPTTSKTLEGSMAFVVLILAAALVLRLAGCVERFSTMRYLLVVIVSGILEALSDQNDNLTLPLYMWSMLVIAEM